MPITTIIDDDGITHIIRTPHKPENGKYCVVERYSGGAFNSSDSAVSLEDALEQHRQSINANCAKRFEDLPAEGQQKILAYITEHFKTGTKRDINYSSYYLKHVVERGIGEYVSNGELKGAMKQAGFSTDLETSPADINYGYHLSNVE